MLCKLHVAKKLFLLLNYTCWISDRVIKTIAMSLSIYVWKSHGTLHTSGSFRPYVLAKIPW